MKEKRKKNRKKTGKQGTVVFKPQKGRFQKAYTKAVLEINGKEYETDFDSILKIELQPKRYEYFCCGVVSGKRLKEGGSFILNENETIIILYKPSRFKILK